MLSNKQKVRMFRKAFRRARRTHVLDYRTHNGVIIPYHYAMWFDRDPPSHDMLADLILALAVACRR